MSDVTEQLFEDALRYARSGAGHDLILAARESWRAGQPVTRIRMTLVRNCAANPYRDMP